MESLNFSPWVRTALAAVGFIIPLALQLSGKQSLRMAGGLNGLAVLLLVAAAISLPSVTSLSIVPRMMWSLWIALTICMAGYYVDVWMRPEPISTDASLGAVSQWDFGGSLEVRTEAPEGMTVRTGGWLPINGVRDVSVDWEKLNGLTLIAELTARISGGLQIGVQETSTNLIVSQSLRLFCPPAYAGQPQPTEVDVVLEVPRLSGPKSYRVVFRRYESTTAGIAVSGRFTARASRTAGAHTPFRTESLGGDLNDFVPFVRDTKLWQPAIGARDVEIDWSETGPVVVKAEVSIVVSCPRGECGGKATVRVRDVTDGSASETEDRLPTPTHGGMGWGMRGSPDVPPASGAMSLVLAQKTGKHTYRLELGADKPGFSIAARGELKFYR